MKRFFSLVTVFFILFTVSTFANEDFFADVTQDNIYYSHIKSLYEKSVVKGYGDESFRPENCITRAEFLSMVLSANNNSQTGASWDVDSAVFARELGYIDKLTLVNPLTINKDYITREEAAAVLSRAFGYATGNIDYFKDKIADIDQINEELLPFVLQMYEKGIMGSDENGMFNPKDFITREEACKFTDLCFFNIEGRTLYEENEEKDNSVKAKKVVAGYTANYIIDENDNLWVFGSNTYGLAGTGEKSGYIITPAKIAENIRSVSPGITHSFAVTNDDVLLGWGNNEAGQLGIKTEEAVVLKPLKIFENISEAFAFESSSVIVGKNKKAYSYGVMCQKDADNLYNYGTMPNEKFLCDNAKEAGWSGGFFVVLKHDGTLVKIIVNDETSAITTEKIAEGIISISTGMNDIFAEKADGRIYNYSNWPSNLEGFWGMLDTEGMIVRNAKLANGGVCGSVTVDTLGNAYINRINMETGDVLCDTSPVLTDILDASFGWNNTLFLDVKGNVWQKGRCFSGNPLEDTTEINQPPYRIYFLTL